MWYLADITDGEMIHTEASLAGGCLNEDLLREFASYDIRCPECVSLTRQDKAPNLYAVPSSFTSFHWSRQYEYTWGILKADLKPTDICLDAGGGYGIFKYALAKRTKKVVVIDKDDSALFKSYKSMQRLEFDNIELINSPIDEYNPPYLFDKIYCLSVLEHIKTQQERISCLKSLYKMLKPNGSMLFSFDVVVHPGSDTYDFYIDTSSALEILGGVGIYDFEFDYSLGAVFDSGCVLNAVCVKATNSPD